MKELLKANNWQIDCHVLEKMAEKQIDHRLKSKNQAYYNLNMADKIVQLWQNYTKHFMFEICPICSGDGFTVEHGNYPHEDGCEPHLCPVQEQCNDCQATGKQLIKLTKEMVYCGVRLFEGWEKDGKLDNVYSYNGIEVEFYSNGDIEIDFGDTQQYYKGGISPHDILTLTQCPLSEQGIKLITG